MPTFRFKNWFLAFGIVCYVLSPSRAQGSENLQTCITDDCVRISYLLTRSIDSDVRPCDDFYAYACGKVLRDTKIPDGWDAVNTANTVVSLMTAALIKSLRVTRPTDPDVVKKSKYFFHSCTSEAEIDNLGVVPLTILLKSLNFPLRPPYLGALDMRNDFGTLLGKMRQYLYLNFPFRLEVDIDPNDKNRHRLLLLVPEKNRSSKIPYRPPTKPTPQPEPQPEPKSESTPTQKPEPQTEPKNESTTPVKKNNTEEKKAAVPVRKVTRKVSKQRSFSLATRSLEGSSTSPAKPKVVKRAVSNVEKGGDEETKMRKRKAPIKKPIPKKPVDEKQEKDNKDKTEVKEEEKPGGELTKKMATPTRKPAVPKGTPERKPQKPDNEQAEEKTNREKQEEEKKIKKKPSEKAAVPKNTREKTPEKPKNEEKEQKPIKDGGKTEEETEEETKETKIVEEKGTDDAQTTIGNEEGSDNKNKESPVTLEITEEKNQPLIEYMIKVANYLYKQTNVKLLETKNDSLRQKVEEVAKIIHEIEKLTVKATEEPGENGKEMTIQELQEFTNSFDTKTEKNPVIDWSNLIKEYMSNHLTIQSQFLEGGRKIYIANMKYLESMLKLFYESNPRALYCAFWWSVVNGVILDLPADLRALESEYKVQAKLYNPSREEYCLWTTINAYSFTAAYDYIVDEKTKQNIKVATDLLGYIYGPLVSMIQNSSILDPRTVMAAIVRYDSGNHMFGIPANMNNAKGLNDLFRGVIFHEYNYFFSRFFQAYESSRSEIEMLDLPASLRTPSPLATTATYNIQMNTQLVPLAYTQFPFMSNGLTSITMGMLVIPFFQQVFHHFDVLGNEYNLWGGKENWWAKKSLKNYYAQAECFVDAYNKECFGDAGCVDGRRTLHENVADYGALKAVIQAYKNFQKMTKEPRLMDFESFSHLRLLTLSFAVSMCQIETPQTLAETLKTSKFAPPSVRVNQVMKNLPEFSEIWGCDADDKMNPAEKCEIWDFIEESKRKFPKSD